MEDGVTKGGNRGDEAGVMTVGVTTIGVVTTTGVVTTAGVVKRAGLLRTMGVVTEGVKDEVR